MNRNKLWIKKSNIPFLEPKGGFDLRMVRYEDIHNICKNDFDELFRIIDPKEKEVILDAGSGYGSVTREILIRTNVPNLDFLLYDIHQIQLERAIDELTGIFKERLNNYQIDLIHGDLRCIDLPNNSIDKIVAKMVIHEIPYNQQSLTFKEFFRVLKQGGKLIIWDTNLNINTQNFFQRVINKKDELSNFSYLKETRYFLREDEMTNLASENGFSNFCKNHTINYKFNSEKRLTPEFKDDYKKLDDWNTFIRKISKSLSPETLNEIHYKDHDRFIEFTIEKAIFSCTK